MKINEDDLHDFFIEWLTGWMKDHTGKSKTRDKKIEKILRKQARKSYLLLSFVMENFRSIVNDYESIIGQINEKGLSSPDSPMRIEFDWHYGYEVLAGELAEIILTGEPLYKGSD